MDAAAITAAIANSLAIAGEGIDFIAGNTLCMIFIGFSALRTGITLFGSAKAAAM